MLILFGIDPWIALWVILLVGFVVGELITISLTSIWFAAGSLIALLAAVIGLNPIAQITLFLLVSLCMRTRDYNETIEVGELAKVLGISGVKLIVEKE